MYTVVYHGQKPSNFEKCFIFEDDVAVPDTVLFQRGILTCIGCFCHVYFFIHENASNLFDTE
jgi:hypothetical protein